MDENRINRLMSNLDNDLLIHELDGWMDDMEIDVDSITQKAHRKLRKGQRAMQNKRKKRIFAIVAASLMVVCGVTTVYASEISNFIRALMSKTSFYGTVVEGQTYYLAEPVALDNGNFLSQAMFEKDELQIQVQTADGSLPNARIRIDGHEMAPQGMEGRNLFFYPVEPVGRFDLIVDDKSYPIQLTSSQPVLGDGAITEAEPNDIRWISMGCKQLANGVQILTAFEDNSVKLVFLEIPRKDRVTQTFEGNSAHSYRESLQPLTGTAPDGKTYTFASDSNEMARPLTRFTTDAPANQEMTLSIPGIVVTKEIRQVFHVSLPEVGKKVETPQIIDLELQKMELQSVERTSETTAALTFALNTGEEKAVRIWEADMESVDAESGDLLWQDGKCTMNVTFDRSLTGMDISVAHPLFIVDGDWTIKIG